MNCLEGVADMTLCEGSCKDIICKNRLECCRYIGFRDLKRRVPKGTPIWVHKPNQLDSQCKLFVQNG